MASSGIRGKLVFAKNYSYALRSQSKGKLSDIRIVQLRLYIIPDIFSFEKNLRIIFVQKQRRKLFGKVRGVRKHILKFYLLAGLRIIIIPCISGSPMRPEGIGICDPKGAYHLLINPLRIQLRFVGVIPHSKLIAFVHYVFKSILKGGLEFLRSPGLGIFYLFKYFVYCFGIRIRGNALV